MVKMVNMVHLSDYSHLQVRLGFFGCERWAVEGNINGVNTEVTLAKTKEARTRGKRMNQSAGPFCHGRSMRLSIAWPYPPKRTLSTNGTN